MEDSTKNRQKKILERLQKPSFAPAAVAGALASFAGAALGFQSKPEARPDGASLVQISLSETKTPSAPVQPRLAIEYRQASDFRELKFRNSLTGITVGAADKIFVLADGEVKIFEKNGASAGNWKVPENVLSMTVGQDECVYIGLTGRVEVFDKLGNRKKGFEAGDSGRPASVTAIKVFDKEILVADAAARCIRRYDADGRQIGQIGIQNKTRGFMLPNRSLDFDVNSKGVIAATDSGRHRVSSWSLSGVPVGYFGKFGLTSPGDFVGCCNPVNLAFTRDDKIVTAEKVIARVKTYDSAGNLLGLIGPEHFDPKCTHLHLAVDSKGRILVADPVRLEIKVFSAMVKPGGRESL